MERFLLTIICLSLFSSINATSLKNVVEKTLDNNPDILSEKFNKEAYLKYFDEEKGDYYPTLDFTGFLEDSKTTSNRDNVATDPSSYNKDGWNAVLQLEQILYDGGRTPSEVEKYRHEYNSNKFRSNTRVEEIVREAINSYLNLVKAQELLDISQNNIETHDDYLKIAQDKEKISGEILESFQVSSKKHFVIDRYLEQKIAKTQALNIFEEKTQQKIDDNICRPSINEILIPKTLEEAIEDSVKSNLKILKAVEDVKKQRENLVQANADFLPTLRFQWQMTWDNDLEYPENGRQDINRLRLLVDWNLYEGGKNSIAKQREKLFLNEQQKILDTVTQEVIKEVKTTYTNYYEKKAKIENMKKYVLANKNIRDVYLKQLEDGTRTFIDILNAESEYFRSQIDAIEEEYQLYDIYFDLLTQRNILTNSILISKNQVCEKFKSTKHENILKKEKTEDNLIDSDVIDSLSEEPIAKQSDRNIDLEIQEILSGNYTVNNQPTETIEKPDENKTEKSSKIQLPEGKYTINLGTLNIEQDIDSFIKKMNLEPKKLYSYNKNEHTVILYDSFDKINDAAIEMNKLSQKLIDTGVYIDNVDKHKKIAEKYKTIN